MLVAIAGMASLNSCRGPAPEDAESGGFPVLNASDCFPDITLVDQHGRNVSLASLKGKPALFDFIYTRCPGPCLLLTSHMKLIANRLGPELGTDVHIVSITVDPEHDHPAELLAYANAQGAEVNGWLFLTGTPKQIDDVMKRFNVIRQREADGTVDHVLEFFLVDANGRAALQYLGEKASPDVIVSDLNRTLAGERLGALGGAGQASRIEQVSG